MGNIVHLFESSFPTLVEYKYLLLFLGSIFEGLNSMVLGGFLVSVGSIKLLPIFLIFTIGYIFNGYLWYSVGYFAGAKPIDKWVRKDKKGRKIVEKVEEYFHKYSGRAIVFTKFTFSLTIATLIMAGSLKYNLKKFSLYNFIGSIGWVALTLFIGYFFGQSYKFFIEYLKGFSYFILFLGGAVILVYILKFIFGSAFIKSLFLKERLKDFSDKLKDGIDKFLSDKE
ncbi:MAG TPA: DedA family protein [Candidatus Paceibacterota bacterium]